MLIKHNILQTYRKN